jgi:HlyD family secretion protein
VDIVRPPKKKTGRNVGIAVAVLAVAAVTWGLAQLKPAAPSVDGALLLTDTVRRGDLVRDVRGPGNLVPERIRWITPLTNGRVERVVALAGQSLGAGEVILEMSSPDQQIQTMRAQQAARQAQLDLETLRNSLQQQRFAQEMNVASAKTANVDAQQRLGEADSLSRAHLISPFEANRLKAAAEEAETRLRVATEQLAMTTATVESQLAVAAANVEQLKAIAANEEERLRSLIVRAPEAGVLQDLSLQPGQWVTSGTTLAKVVQPGKLKAVLRIPESLAKDVQIGQAASVDTRNGIIPGHVSRKDPAAIGGSVTVDVALDGELPRGAVPDLSVDGTVTIDHLKDVLFVGRPVSGTSSGNIGLFKVVENGRYAIRVTVQLGRTAVNTVEIVNGLQPGDRIILSDMGQFDNVDRVRIK